MTTPLFLLRTLSLGISISDMDLLTVGLIVDMYTERANDREEYPDVAQQEDFDIF